MTVFKNSNQKRQPPLYQVNLYLLSVLSAALFVSRACLNCDFIIARLIVIVNIKSLQIVLFYLLHKIERTLLCIIHKKQFSE